MYSLVISNTGFVRGLMLLIVFNNRLSVFCTNLTFVDMIIGVNWFFGSHFSPISSMARLLITSLTFMLDWVPEPVCHTTSGKLSFNFPDIT